MLAVDPGEEKAGSQRSVFRHRALLILLCFSMVVLDLFLLDKVPRTNHVIFTIHLIHSVVLTMVRVACMLRLPDQKINEKIEERDFEL